MRYAYFLDLSVACPTIYKELGMIALTEDQADALNLAGLTVRSHRDLVKQLDVTVFVAE